MIILFAGVSGSGKSFFKNKFIKSLECKNLVIVTDRPKRPGEINGIDKEFDSTESIKKRIRNGEFTYYFELFGYMYCYKREYCESKDVYVSEIHYENIVEFKNAVPNVIAVYLLPNNINNAKNALLNRGYDDFILNKRYMELEEHFVKFDSDLLLQKEFDYIFVNDYGEKTSKQIIGSLQSIIERNEEHLSINFFKPEENFEEIINKFMKEEVISISQIPTGWTNLVFEVESESGNKFFRFPRNDFWAKMIVKDCCFCQFVLGKTSFKTPEMVLFYDDGRPFSVHSKIDGDTLSTCASNLNESSIKNISEDIVKFICELHQLSQADMLFECQVSVFDFLKELAELHFGDINSFDVELFSKHDTKMTLAHGDLNPGNLIIENGRVVGILDFCFAGYGNPYIDLSRIIGRLPSNYKDVLEKSYENIFEGCIDLALLDRFISAWNCIDNEYIKYIKMNNPDIKLPD